MVKERKGFMKWYFSPQGKKVTGVVYSLGAAVVIIGALFKILHLPGAGPVLMIGMLIEAFLFALGALDDPHPEFHWEHVFPQLNSKEADPLMNHLGKGFGGNASANVGGGINTLGGTISETDAKKLTESIKNMSETAAQLSNISKVAGLTDSYAENLTKASEAAAKFAEKQSGLDSASEALLSSYHDIAENLENAKAGTKTFAENANSVSRNLASYNSAFELQLKSITAANSDVEKLQGLASETAKSMDSYKQMSEQLAKNIADLNGVYGNMLNALKA